MERRLWTAFRLIGGRRTLRTWRGFLKGKPGIYHGGTARRSRNQNPSPQRTRRYAEARRENRSRGMFGTRKNLLKERRRNSGIVIRRHGGKPRPLNAARLGRNQRHWP